MGVLEQCIFVSCHPVPYKAVSPPRGRKCCTSYGAASCTAGSTSCCAVAGFIAGRSAGLYCSGGPFGRPFSSQDGNTAVTVGNPEFPGLVEWDSFLAISRCGFQVRFSVCDQK